MEEDEVIQQQQSVNHPFYSSSQHMSKKIEESPSFDPQLLKDLEAKASHVSENFTHLLGGLQAQLFAISQITLKSAEAYGLAGKSLEDITSKCVKDTTSLISKMDELNLDMQAVHVMSSQIKEIKKALDILEELCK